MKNILSIIKISKPLYGLVAIIAILILITALLELVAPILSKFIVDEITKSITGKGGNLEFLTLLISFAFGASILALILTTISNRLGDHFAGKLRKYLTEKFYNKALTLPQSHYDTEISGKVISQLSRGIFTIGQFLNTTTNFILPTFLQSIFTIAVLAYYNIPIAIFTFTLFPIYLVVSYHSAKKYGQEEVLKNQISDQTMGRISEVISNLKLVRTFMNEKNEAKIVEDNMSKINKIYARQSNTYHRYDFLRGLSLNIIITLVNIFVFYGTFQGSMTLGEMVLILQLVSQARRPLFAMSFILSNIQLAEAGSKEFFEILALESSEDFYKEAAKEKLKHPAIEFKNVTFSYKTSGTVLKDVSFKIDAAEKIALVGHSGAGKSTIVNLILKFYEPTAGKIFIKGKAYNKLTNPEIRNNISLVFQDSELFSTTISENVAYGSKANEKDVINALKLANAWEFVQKLPKGLGSEIGERGVRLSGGQKQRIQIARAILKNAPILILDEATSSLDAKSEREVQLALENLMEEKLVIIIAHRFSTIQNVNRIIVIDEGKIVDYGSPRELAERPGIYRDLLNYQVEGNKKLLEQYEIF